VCLHERKKLASFSFFLICVAAICFTAGCDPDRSVNPFYRPQDVFFDAGLLGEWQGVDLSSDSLVVKAKSADSYSVELTQIDRDKREQTSWTFEAHLFSHNKTIYLDLIPTSFQVTGKRQRYKTEASDLNFFVPVHTVMQLNHSDENLALTWTGSGEMSSFFKKEDEASKERELQREKRKLAILTMSTEQLQEEVLGASPDGDAEVEMGLHFTRRK